MHSHTDTYTYTSAYIEWPHNIRETLIMRTHYEAMQPKSVSSQLATQDIKYHQGP